LEKIGLDFKLIIAYLIPGTIGLYAAAMLVPAVGILLGGQTSVPQGASIILVLVLAIASGIVINAITWATVRPIVEASGAKRPPEFDYSKLSNDNKAAINNIRDNFFSYYQSYANMFTAILLVFFAYWYAQGLPRLDLTIIGTTICIVLFFAARDSLKRTYFNMQKILKDADAQASKGHSA
jgi:hypothetical protein